MTALSRIHPQVPGGPSGLSAWLVALAGTAGLSALGADPVTAATVVIALGGLCAELAQRLGPAGPGDVA